MKQLILLSALIPCLVGSSTRSVMVIAPHPDDETLIAAGIIRRAVTLPIPVRIVVVTNGDILGEYLGEVRELESLKAMQILGVDQKNVEFLGYGDTTLKDISKSKDSKKVFPGPTGRVSTYTSSEVANNNYRHRRGISPGLYNADSIVEDLVNVISETTPTEIYTTSFFDQHGDHAATAKFLALALKKIRQTNSNYRPEVFESLVHAPADPKWPYNRWAPKSDFPMPEFLKHTPLKWADRVSISVPKEMKDTDPDRNLKLRAIYAYESQTNRSLKSWMTGFVRAEEFFWRKK